VWGRAASPARGTGAVDRYLEVVRRLTTFAHIGTRCGAPHPGRGGRAFPCVVVSVAGLPAVGTITLQQTGSRVHDPVDVVVPAESRGPAGGRILVLFADRDLPDSVPSTGIVLPSLGRTVTEEEALKALDSRGSVGAAVTAVATAHLVRLRRYGVSLNARAPEGVRRYASVASEGMQGAGPYPPAQWPGALSVLRLAAKSSVDAAARATAGGDDAPSAQSLGVQLHQRLVTALRVLPPGWSAEEGLGFAYGFNRFGKQFHQVASMVEGKTTRKVVELYFWLHLARSHADAPPVATVERALKACEEDAADRRAAEGSLPRSAGASAGSSSRPSAASPGRRGPAVDDAAPGTLAGAAEPRSRPPGISTSASEADADPWADPGAAGPAAKRVKTEGPGSPPSPAGTDDAIALLATSTPSGIRRALSDAEGAGKAGLSDEEASDDVLVLSDEDDEDEEEDDDDNDDDAAQSADPVAAEPGAAHATSSSGPAGAGAGAVAVAVPVASQSPAPPASAALLPSPPGPEAPSLPALPSSGPIVATTTTVTAPTVASAGTAVAATSPPAGPAAVATSTHAAASAPAVPPAVSPKQEGAQAHPAAAAAAEAAAVVGTVSPAVRGGGSISGSDAGSDAIARRRPRRQTRQALAARVRDGLPASARAGLRWCSACGTVRPSVRVCASAPCSATLCERCFRSRVTSLRLPCKASWSLAAQNKWWLCFGCCPPMASAAEDDTALTSVDALAEFAVRCSLRRQAGHGPAGLGAAAMTSSERDVLALGAEIAVLSSRKPGRSAQAMNPSSIATTRQRRQAKAPTRFNAWEPSTSWRSRKRSSASRDDAGEEEEEEDDEDDDEGGPSRVAGGAARSSGSEQGRHAALVAGAAARAAEMRAAESVRAAKRLREAQGQGAAGMGRYGPVRTPAPVPMPVPMPVQMPMQAYGAAVHGFPGAQAAAMAALASQGMVSGGMPHGADMLSFEMFQQQQQQAAMAAWVRRREEEASGYRAMPQYGGHPRTQQEMMQLILFQQQQQQQAMEEQQARMLQMQPYLQRAAAGPDPALGGDPSYGGYGPQAHSAAAYAGSSTGYGPYGYGGPQPPPPAPPPDNPFLAAVRATYSQFPGVYAELQSLLSRFRARQLGHEDLVRSILGLLHAAPASLLSMLVEYVPADHQHLVLDAVATRRHHDVARAMQAQAAMYGPRGRGAQ